jgi:NAD(P)-dependent dehydrogenase (short-subunit alcohol dehydrogenase family)
MISTSTRVALVTGAGSGIGQAASLALAQDGFALILAGRRAEPLEATATQVVGLGGRAIAVPADISKPDSVIALFQTIEREFGRLDVLFNNAGTNTRNVPMEELTPAEWQSVIDVNLTGAFLCTQQAIRLMKKQDPRGGRIINNGSISAYVPRPHSVAYTASKHAISGLTKATALDGRRFDIACGQIDIGNATTPMRARAAKGTLQADGSVAVEPGIDVSHVARAVSYMASLPLDANVLSLNIMATQMPFVGRG